MKLALYGGGDFEDNKDLDEKMLDLVSSNPLFTYIPSSYFQADLEFDALVEHYRELGVKRFIKFDLDSDYSIALKRAILKSEIIYLGGGNTFYFLKHLRKNKFLHDLRGWVHEGGLLMGLSAGAILMTRDITTASIPEFDRDDNEEAIKNLKAINLVDFEFFPHYRNSKRYDQELKTYSESIDHPLYACVDGAGILINEDETRFVGKTACFHHGHKYFINK